MINKTNEESKFMIGGYDQFYMGEPEFTFTDIISKNAYLIYL